MDQHWLLFFLDQFIGIVIGSIIIGWLFTKHGDKQYKKIEKEFLVIHAKLMQLKKEIKHDRNSIY